ncbi:MAG: amino acid permease [Asticcacaulis sp.]
MMGLFGRTKPIDDASVHRENALPKTLSWPHLIAMGIGAVIGMGIFTLTGIGAHLAGPGVILSFALAGIVCALAALAYAEVATIIPAAGSAYTYTYSVLGEGIAWVVGWSLILEYALGSAAVATGWAAHMNGLLQSWGVHIPAMWLAGPMEGGAVNILAVAIVAAITGMLLIGARESATVNIGLVAIKLIALGTFIVISVPAIKAGNYHPFMPEGFFAHLKMVDGHTVMGTDGQPMKFGVMAAAAIMFFAFYGFDAVSTSAEEAKNPGRDLTIGIVGSMAICTLFYMLVGACVVGVLPYTEVAKSNGEPLPYILRLMHQPFIADLIGIAAVLALPSVLLVFMFGQSRILFVIARDGLIPQSLSKLDRRGLPVVMTLIVGIFIAAFAGLVPLDQIANLANSGTLVAFIAVSLAMMILRVTRPDLKRAFKVPFHWVVGVLAIAGCVFLFTSLNVSTMIYFLLWNIIGVVVYFLYGFWNSRLRKEAEAAS